MNYRCFLSLTFALFCFISPAMAQMTEIHGTVKDDVGTGPIEGVAIRAYSVRTKRPVSEEEVTDADGQFSLSVTSSQAEGIFLEFLPPLGSQLAPGTLNLLSTESPNPPIVDLQRVNKILQFGNIRYKAVPSMAPPTVQDPCHPLPDVPSHPTDEERRTLIDNQIGKFIEFERIFIRIQGTPEKSDFDTRMIDYIRDYVSNMDNAVQRVPQNACCKAETVMNSISPIEKFYSDKRSTIHDIFDITYTQDNDSFSTSPLDNGTDVAYCGKVKTHRKRSCRVFRRRR